MALYFQEFFKALAHGRVVRIYLGSGLEMLEGLVDFAAGRHYHPQVAVDLPGVFIKLKGLVVLPDGFINSAGGFEGVCVVIVQKAISAALL